MAVLKPVRFDESKGSVAAYLFGIARHGIMRRLSTKTPFVDAPEIVAVPLFIAAPPSDLSSRVKSSVPLRITAGVNGDPVAAEIVLDRASEVSTNSASEVVVLVSHRSTAGNDQRWVPDLQAGRHAIRQYQQVDHRAAYRRRVPVLNAARSAP